MFLLLLILNGRRPQAGKASRPLLYRAPPARLERCLTRDSVASISMGLVSIATTAGWKSCPARLCRNLCLPPWQLSAHRWYTWSDHAIVGVDLLYCSYPHRPPSSAIRATHHGRITPANTSTSPPRCARVEQQRRDSHVGSAAR